MKNKDLILICNQFPYSFGEAFLANEFKYLYPAFEKIIVITRTDEKKITRLLPNNVEVIRMNPKLGISRLYPILFSIVLNLKKYRKIVKNEKKSIKRIFGTKPTKAQKNIYRHDLIKAIEIKNFLTKKVVCKLENDIVLYSYWQNSSAIAVILLRMQLKQRCVDTICRAHRGDLYFYARKNHYLSYRDFISQEIDKLFFISNDGKKYQEGVLGKTYPSFKVAQLGTERKKEDAFKEKRKEFIVVSCSNIIAVKRVDLIIETLSKIDDIEVIWIHFGDGVLGEEIRNIASIMLDGKSNIQYDFKGRVLNEHIHKYYAKNHIDLFINVSESEGIPVSIMEAMSYGIPVVATNVGGTKEIVSKKTGLLIGKDFNPADLANELVEILNPKNLEMLRINSRNFWEEKYNARTNYKKFINEIFEYENKLV